MMSLMARTIRTKFKKEISNVFNHWNKGERPE